jgi:serine/threonine protein kinase
MSPLLLLKATGGKFDRTWQIKINFKMTEKVKPENDDNRPADVDSVGMPVDQTVFRRSNQNQHDSTRTKIQQQTDSTRIQPTRPVANRPASARPASDATNIQRKQSDNNATRIRTPQRVVPDQHQGLKASDQTRVPNRAQASGQGDPGSITRDTNQRQVLKGRFTLEKVIGVGGMGVVYKATDRLKVEARDREPFVAIKVLSEEFRSHPESFIALQRESRKTQRIAHPNVVKVYDFDRDGDTVFMTMEYMEGVPLDQLIKQYSTTGLPREEAWSILNGLCSALIHAHAENIVHSDFKPGNIFITDAGIPKIFDFGIARAVANVDRQTGKHKDRTVFDAGSLGALTPAYASLEMLQGQEPDVRDDVYALGCIAYEILTGEHPFNRIPADEAFKSRLKPRKISNIKKRQWKAIEKALQFKREDRINSVEEFYKLIQPKARQLSILLSTIVVLVAIGAATYLIVSREPTPQKQTAIQVDEIEFKVRHDLFKEKLAKLISDPSFTSEWQDSVWEEISGLSALLKGRSDPLLTSSREKIYNLYLNQYRMVVAKGDYTLAQTLLKNAYRYTDDTALLDSESGKLAELIRQRADREKALAEERQHKQDVRETKTKQVANNSYIFDLALKNVNQQLECQTNLNMREFGVAVEKLRSVDVARYAKLENGIVVTLAECISHVGKTQPERAMEDKNYALRIFKNNRLIEAINIVPRDACNLSIAGLGARGERAICRDKLVGYNSDGPAMVVIPGNGEIKPFAIGKYEISEREINIFCRLSSTCTPVTTSDEGLPAVNISIATVQEYLRWLSQITKQKYRLPTRKEWVYAANATNHFVDPNRNCALNSRGIEKGGQLVRANTGVQNSWGLVNYLGNAQEWVYDKSRNLIAIGGSFEVSMDKCNVGSYVRHSGNPDEQTGFRVVREVNR